jgi:type I restriction enzyme R subunit
MTSIQQRAALQRQIWAIANSLKREFASDSGTELNAVLPKMSPLNPQYQTKKQSVFQKIAAFVEKFKDLGGVI